jgi:ApaG protein
LNLLARQTTHDIRVTVLPTFVPAQSDTARRRYVFVYDVEIENLGDRTSTLLRRHWRIHDEGGEDATVDGEGVIGKQPTLRPGESHRYQSFCVLKSPRGHMEGFYTFTGPDGEEFRVTVPRFQLDAGWFGMGPVAIDEN